MKICMVTSFFGRHSFGGDSVYVERLSVALQRRGHEVHVAYSSGAFHLARYSQPLRSYQAHPRLFVHDIGGGIPGKMAAFWNHQTGGTGLKFQALGSLLKRNSFDLIHLHNVSLLGGRTLPLLLDKQPQALKLATMHDYWWICPQSLLWKYGRRICDTKACHTCAVSARRPPQFWRQRGWFNSALAHVDAILFPSGSTQRLYASHGFVHPGQYVLPGLLPKDWVRNRGAEGDLTGSQPRKYFAAAGRLVAEKGFQTLIPLMRRQLDTELRIAGSGPAEDSLRSLARGMPNVKFEGLLEHDRIRSLFQNARAVVIPSLFPETFCMVAAEAMSLGVPVLVRNRGSLPELIEVTSGGLTFNSETELEEQMRRIVSDDRLFASLSHASLPSVWLEEAHTDAYLQIAAGISAPKMEAT
jgi:glycosyltransferase involved in cell wall biosynthesis